MSGTTIPSVFPVPEIVERYQGRVLSVEDIMSLLPHRPPFLLVDRVVELDPGVSAVGLKNVTINEPFFVGHFPGHPIMPGVLIIEALAQVAGVVVLTGIERGDRIAYFTGIKEAKFREPVRPGDQLRLSVTIDRVNYRFGKFFATMTLQATVDERTAAEALGSFVLMDPQ